MGQHSSGNRWPFIRSAIGWFLPWVLITGVVAMAVWVAVDVVGGRETERPSASRPVATETLEPEEEPTDLESPEVSPEPTETLEEIERTPAPELITEGISVQVLNGTPDDSVDEAVADRLAQLGFQVVSVQSASRTYTETVVFWSTPEAQEAALALADSEGWNAEPKPDNLSAEVDLHVVIGVDEV